MKRHTQSESIDPSPFAPARGLAEWEAQGWATDPEPLTAAPRLETTVSIRFDPDSARLLRSAVRLSGLTKSAFIRRATIAAAERTLAETQALVSLRLVPLSAQPPSTSSRAAVLEPSPAPTQTSLRHALDLVETA